MHYFSARIALALALTLPFAASLAWAQSAPPPDSLAARWARAVESSAPEAARALLVWGPSPEMPGDPPLYRAARSGSTQLVAMLLEAGANPDDASAQRGDVTPLHAALFFGHEDAAGLLLGAGADLLRRTQTGFAAFDWALERGAIPPMLGVVEALESGARHERDAGEAGSLALVRAVLRRDAASLRRHLSEGADPDAPNALRYGPLSLAARLGYDDMLNILLESGADVDIGRVEFDEASPLHQAARGGQTGAARLLLEAGADLEKRNMRGFTALHLAALYDRAPVATLLLETGVDPAVRSSDPLPSMDEYTAFDYATEQGPAVADAILAWTSDERPNDHLALAALRGDTATLAALLGTGADPDAVSTPGALPLALAVRYGHSDAARILLEAGADPDLRQQTRYGTTALMEATRDDRHAIADLLLSAGADPDARDRYGDTALNWAATAGASRMVELLLQTGARTDLRGLSRQTAEEIAHARGDTSLAERIRLATSR